MFQEASISLERRNELMTRAFERIERELELLGATAIEDKLQEGVPETIRSLSTAGISIWMLTGDKVIIFFFFLLFFFSFFLTFQNGKKKKKIQLETAINVGYACSLIHRDSKLLILSDNDNSPASQKIKRFQYFFEFSFLFFFSVFCFFNKRISW